MPSRIRRARRVVLAEQEERRRNHRSLRGLTPTTGRDSTRPYDNEWTKCLCDYTQRVIHHALARRAELVSSR